MYLIHSIHFSIFILISLLASKDQIKSTSPNLNVIGYKRIYPDAGPWRGGDTGDKFTGLGALAGSRGARKDQFTCIR
jgi:hypothetical protein